jgi:hypothetical protein
MRRRVRVIVGKACGKGCGCGKGNAVIVNEASSQDCVGIGTHVFYSKTL